VICLLLDAGAQLEAKGDDGRTAVAVAALNGRVDAVKLLLVRGANPNAADAVGQSPLMGAALTKHTACVRELLPVSDLSIANRQGGNAFHTCIATGNMECFELLLPLMSDVDVRTVQGVSADGSPDPHNNSTPLHLACSFGQHDMVKALLRRGALRTARDSDQRTPLHDAAQCGHLSCVSTLLGKPGDYQLTPDEVNATDMDGLTPLHFAACHGHANICGALIKAGARLDAVSSTGHTPLMVAQHEHPSRTALIDLLAGRGPEHPPGTVCDHCGIPEAEAWGAKLHACSGCLLARYCGKTCSRAAWPAHRAECSRLKAAREDRIQTIER
jgi:ankyrin repeat protein